MSVFTPTQFAGKLVELGEKQSEVPKLVIEEGSLLIKTDVMARTPARLSGVGRRGAKLNVRYKTGPSGGGWQSVVFATGPFQLWERSTAAHTIPRQSASGRGRQRYAVFSDEVFSSVQHPGTKGHHTFEQGVNEAVPVITAKFESASYLAAQSVFF